MSGINLSSSMLENIESGKAILFLGSGASIGAIQGGQSKPLNGDALRDAISDKFLEGSLKNKPLAQVADIAKDGPGLFAVQDFVKEQFIGLKPAAFHLRIPSFRWHAIITTNYDYIVEHAYRDAPDKKQTLFPLIGDNDNFADATKDIYSVPYLKLHGCLSRINDPDLPLILASEEYAKHKRNRSTLFKLFSDWAREHPIIFCGYDLADPNITQILYDIGDSSIARPRHALVKRSFSDHESRYYSGRRIDPIVSTFDNFISYLDTSIPEHKRTLSALIKNSSILSKWIQSGSESEGLSFYLANELEYVNIDQGSKGIAPIDFYNGVSAPWSAFSDDLDSSRNITDTITLEAILEQDLEKKCNLYLIQGHAGSGKSIILKRAAWDATTKHSLLVFFLKEGGSLKREYLEEIWHITKEPFLIFVESCLPHIDELIDIYSYFKRYSIPITLIIEARTNEWNVAGDALDKYITKSYEVIDLTEKEITSLLDNLEKNRCLGALEDVPKESRIEHIRNTSEKQLLVTLLEATQGKPLRDIVLDEYNNITPQEARILYLDVCTLHRFGVAVRSGLISRVSNIPFSYFSTKLLKPLEHVVRTFIDSYSRDNAYRSRHQEIARIVFDGILDTPERKVEQIVRLISNINIDYESDRRAFEQMIKGRNVADAFAQKFLGEKVYTAAFNSGANESYITHQQAIFELNHPNGDYNKALSLIDRAFNKAKHGQKSIKHTKALILRRLAQDGMDPLLKDRYRAEAKLLLKQQLKLKDSSYSFSALLNILLDELRERFDKIEHLAGEIDARDRVVEELCAELEDILYRGTQENPGDGVLLSIEAKYAALIGESPRAERLIETAFNKNPDSTYTAISLAKLKEKNNDFEGAFRVLSESLDRNPASKQLHLNIAKLCIHHKEKKYIKFIDSHLRSAFSDGDSNYEAQYWYARQNYLYGDKSRAKKIYLFMQRANISPKSKNIKRGTVCNSDGTPVNYCGTVVNREDNFCFVTCAEIGENVYIHYSDFDNVEWDHVTHDCKITYQLSFSLRSAVGVHATILGD